MATSYGDAAAAYRNPLVQMIPTDYDKRTPMPDGSQNNPMNSELGRNVTNTLNAIPGAAAVPGSAARAGGLVARAFGAAAPAAPYAPAAGLAAAVGVGRSAAEPAPAPAAPATVPSPGNYTYQQQGEAGPPVPSTNPAAASAPPAPAMTGLVSRIGNSYSGTNVGGDISVNGAEPRGGFVGSSNPLVQRALQQGSGQVPQFNAPQAAHSGNDWEAANNLRNLAVSASSITNNGGRYDSRQGRNNVGPSLAQAVYLDAQRADMAARGQQPGLDAATNQVNSNLQREGMQQDGANGRNLVQAMLEQQKINQTGEAQGYANRAAGLVERMRNQVAAETDPTKRRSLVDTMMAVEGKQTQADPYLVVPGGQQIDPISQRAYNVPSTVLNRQTGQWMQQPGQGAQQPSENHIAWLKQNPGQAANFDQIYGQGAAKRVMG